MRRREIRMVVFKWKVTHPERGSVEVTAASRYEAVISAAKVWGERWTQIAHDLTVEKLEAVGET